MSQSTHEETRADRLKRVTGKTFDLVVIGAGVHGAFASRSAAAAGLSVLLLDAQDYGSATSSRSSKMLHGGLRYLEQLELKLVFEALRERAMLRQIAPHLTRVQRFVYPIIRGKTRPSYQVRIGLGAYDLLASLPISKIPRAIRREFQWHESLEFTAPVVASLTDLGLQADAYLSYFDGQVDDARLVIAAVRDARTLGAESLNYAPVHRLARTESAADESVEFEVTFRSVYPESEGVTVLARTVINAAGPWVNDALESSSRKITLRFSRGSHLIFDRPWKLPALILPTPVKGRYYFVWPHQLGDRACTLVGTTDQEISGPTADPRATDSEIDELLGYLERDLPGAGLCKESLLGTFAGIRVLPGASSARSSDLSRATRILNDRGLISIVGGKLTTGRLEAERAVRLVLRELSPSGARRTTPGEASSAGMRPLPGGEGGQFALTEAANVLTHRIIQEGLFSPEDASVIATLAVSRFGTEAAGLSLSPAELRKDERFREQMPVLPGEVRLTISEEDPITVEDVVRRRLGLVVLPNPNDALVRFTASELSRRTGRTEAELLTEFREVHAQTTRDA